MIRVKLREAMENYRLERGVRLTYEKLSELTGLSRATIESIGTRPQYNASLKTIFKLCLALDCTPGELLDMDRSVQSRHKI